MINEQGTRNKCSVANSVFQISPEVTKINQTTAFCYFTKHVTRLNRFT
jgi:hypothetical protein